WCVGEIAGGLHKAIALSQATGGGSDGGVRLTRAVMDTVDEVGRVVTAAGIDCGFVKGGVIRLARTRPQLDRQFAEVGDHRAAGFDDDDLRLLDVGEARSMLAATGVLGGVYFAAAARVQPLHLASGVAREVERLGGVIHEDTRVIEVVAGRSGGAPRVVTERGTVTADVVVRATEGYTGGLPGERRSLIPFSSSMVATEPLSAEMWDEIGLTDRQTFGDDRRMVIYGQRTTDDRIAFGGRGAPYLFGSKVRTDHSDPAVSDRVVQSLHELLPVLRRAEITHRWGGVLGIPRDWRPSVGLDRATGVAWAGGYVGEGVAAANLAGRTLCDLILERDSDLTTLPWVDHRSRRWEPEPLRWAGVTAMLRLSAFADRDEVRTGRPSRLGAVADRLR
ncbi:MAG: FAD-binding oxidoreductase, partial [Ilumatobacter sp.]|uniref:NAD(P)/FAD-dependent oxidoreductase n=1 Tax=Ilumatobacter sp. TaxID=1967498 RepID=UPI0032990387